MFDRLSLLIVDDNRHARAVVRSIATGFGFRAIKEAGDVASGLGLVSSWGPDLIICDYDMPARSGAELARAVRRSSGAVAYTGIIALTGFSDRRRITELRDAGVSEVMVKPVSAATLLSKLVAAIDRPRPFVENTHYRGPCRRRRMLANFSGPFRRADDANADAGDPSWLIP